MQLNISEYYPTQWYPKNLINYVLCHVRQSLIKESPEEIIRQAFVSFLLHEKNVPIGCIDVEYSMSKVKNGDRKRADIVVYSDDSKSKVILVVECKKSNLILTDRATDQVKYYNDILKAQTVIITNGIDFLALTKIDGEYKQIQKVPSFNELLKTKSLKNQVVEYEPWIRHKFLEFKRPKVSQFYLDYGHIGIDTNIKLYPFIMNLIGFFLSADSDFSGIQFKDYKVIKDLGVKIDGFGNPSGGSWVGEYRKLLIADNYNNHQILGFSIIGKGKFIKHKRYGTTKASTCLIVSIEDDFGKSHNSIQLSIDRELQFEENFYTLFHDGKLTSGRGPLKISEVKNFIKAHDPDLFDHEGKIKLGEFEKNELYTTDKAYCIEFIGKLISYSILRDKLRCTGSLIT